VSAKKVLDFTEKSVILIKVMREKIQKLNDIIDDFGLFELNAWLWITGGAALTAAILVLLSGEGPEIYRYWRVFFLNL
jgi:hypothetical protein